MKKCPFNKMNPCDQDCALYMEVIRAYDSGKQEVVKGCVFTLDHEERRNQTQRIAMMQAEVGETKNATVFQSLVTLGDPQGRQGIERILKRHIPPKALPEGG